MTDQHHEADSEFEITVHSTELLEQPTHAPPYTRPVEIIVEALAWQQMSTHASEDLSYESGGIMLGDIYSHERGVAVRITTAVPAREAVNNITSIQFTYNAWRQMEEERRQRAPTEKLIGWYHTHPGFTAFFSSTDHFMHEHFFIQPWHVALVIDPIKGEHVFYRWEDGKVVRSPEFLLQIRQWPRLETPLHATLTQALEQSARQLSRTERPSARNLITALREVSQHLPRKPTDSPLNDLLPLIVACAGLDPAAIAEARELLRRERPAERPITRDDLEHCSSNRNPTGAICIDHGWLVQQINQRSLHLHSVEMNQPFCSRIELPVATRDVALAQSGTVLALMDDRKAPISIYLLLPPLPLMRLGGYTGEPQKAQLLQLPIDWGTVTPARRAGRAVLGRRHLYLLTRTEIYVLHTTEQDIPRQFTCLGVHAAARCGWSSFEQLTEWAIDPAGNLYLLRAESKEVWRFDQVQGEWQQLVCDEQLDQPLSLCAGQTTLSIYTGGAQPGIVQYSLPEGKPLWRRVLDPNLAAMEIRRIFSDGFHGLYFVGRDDIYFLR